MQTKINKFGVVKKLSVQKATLTLILALAFIGAGCSEINHPASNLTESNASQANTAQANAPQTNQSVPTSPPNTAAVSYSSVVKRAAPAVVTVQAARRVRSPQQYPFTDDPRFRDNFGDNFDSNQRQPQQQSPVQVQHALGSGVIVSADGYILINHHVIDGAEEIKVELDNHHIFEAQVVGSDPLSDLAVLKIDAQNLPILSPGDSNAVEVGDIVLAIGNPLGLQQTVTAGIISAKGRVTGLSDGSFEDFLQTDAPINQGNSGGALINTNGELIGINSQILSPTGGNIGIGFAIPSNMAKNVMDQLIKNGTVRRGQLGVAVQPVTDEIARSLNLTETHGVEIRAVQPDSAAAHAGLRQKDIITSFNGEQVNESNEFRNRVANTPPGTEAKLTIWREGSEQQISVTLDELPSTKAARK